MRNIIGKLGIIAMLACAPALSVWAESSEEDVRAMCEQQATDAGITDAEERAVFIQQCIDDAQAASSSNQ